MIDWGSFVLVAVVAVVGACLLVGFAALGIRLLDESRYPGRPARIGAIASFAVCVAAVGFGVYLIIPGLA